MVKFIGVQELIELLRTIGVEEFLSNLIRYTRDDFLRWPQFEKSPRLASHSANGVIELMPTSDGELYSFKYVNGHPINTQFRKLTVTAFGVLADVRSGYPLLVSEMTISTALRTAATSALAGSYLARRGSRDRSAGSLALRVPTHPWVFRPLATPRGHALCTATDHADGRLMT